MAHPITERAWDRLVGATFFAIGYGSAEWFHTLAPLTAVVAGLITLVVGVVFAVLITVIDAWLYFRKHPA